MKTPKLLFVLCILLSCPHILAQKYQNTWSSIDRRPVPEWFMDAKFGIFIHWGVYSVPSWRKLESARYASYAEWYYARVMDNKENGGYDFHRKNYGENFEYRDFAPMFKAELYDPGLWADLFKKSGAKYVVLTSKHHDGFCLWPTKNKHKKNWNSGDTGPFRDLLGDLAIAVRDQGLKMGFYYSIPDWESIPRYKEPLEYFIRKDFVDTYGLEPETYRDEVLWPQLRELVVNYKPSIIFSDAGEWLYDDEFWGTRNFLAWLYNESPSKDEVVVNDRWYKGMPGVRGDYFSSEYSDAEVDASTKPWEESRGIGGSYGFNRAENISDYSTSKELIYELIDIVSRGGNLLLNVGPTADGRIPVIMQERLLDIGNWLDVNGEAIYESRKHTISSDKYKDQHLFYTTKNDLLYCIFTHWNDFIEISIHTNKKIDDIKILGYDGSINWEQLGDNRYRIHIPPLTIKELPGLYAWTFKIMLTDL